MPEKLSIAVASDVVNSWKEIAAYLGRDVRTAVRWEQTRGLPVHRLPGGPKPAVYALRSELELWRSSRGTRPAPGDEGELAAQTERQEAPALAVLPFASLSDEKENEYFSDGLADAIITELSGTPGLRVVARTSSFAFRGRKLDAREIGVQLGVQTLLEGSVQKAGGRVRVSAQLVTCQDGCHIWSSRYDRELSDVFTVQEEIAAAIAAALKFHIGRE